MKHPSKWNWIRVLHFPSLPTKHQNQSQEKIRNSFFYGKLKTFSGELIQTLSIADAQVSYEKQSKTMPIVITEQQGPTLLGRNWLGELKLHWNNSLSLQHTNYDPAEQLLCEYKEVFAEGLGKLKNIVLNIPVEPDAEPKYFRARAVPYALKEYIEIELDRLVKNGVYQQLPQSKWAAPVAPVIKEDGSVRICGDYKLTVNKVANVDKYPVPKTEDVLVKMNGRRIFCKLDLSNEYQELALDKKSREYLTINKHKGLYQPTRLQGYKLESIPLLVFFIEKWKNALVTYHD